MERTSRIHQTPGRSLLSAIGRNLDQFFTKYEDVERVIITADNTVTIDYGDGHGKATSPIVDEIRGILKRCPYLNEREDSSFRIVLVRSEKDA